MMGRRESVIALIILLAAGVFFHCLSHGEGTPLHHSLTTFPLHIGPWVGEAHTLAPTCCRSSRWTIISGVSTGERTVHLLASILAPTRACGKARPTIPPRTVSRAAAGPS